MSFLAPTLRRACLPRAPAAPLQQLRGKKKLAKAPTINVLLTQDVPKYGPKGAIVPVSRGRMRNIWYPRKMAEYMTKQQFAAAPKSSILQERDVNFRPDLEQQQRKVELSLLSPTKTVSLLESFLPPTLSFTRATTTAEEKTIQGSITTGDIAGAIRAIAIANGDEGARVVIKPENIVFTDKDVMGEDRVKELGSYGIEIAYKGADARVKRTVVVEKEEVQEE